MDVPGTSKALKSFNLSFHRCFNNIREKFSNRFNVRAILFELRTCDICLNHLQIACEGSVVGFHAGMPRESWCCVLGLDTSFNNLAVLLCPSCGILLNGYYPFELMGHQFDNLTKSTVSEVNWR